MDANKSRHNYEDFYEESIYQMSINKGRITITQSAHVSIVGIISFLIFFVLVKSFEEEI